MTKAELIKRLEKLVAASQSGDETFHTEIKINEWENYGKSRTYFSIVRTRENSRHYEKMDCGYFDNQTETYVAGKARDLSEDSVYDFGGNNLVSLIEEVVVEETVETEETTEVKVAEVTVKYNRSQIFKNAWKLVKEAGISISEALKVAWAFAKKEATKVEVAEPFKVCIDKTKECVGSFKKFEDALRKVNSFIQKGYRKVDVILYKWSVSKEKWIILN